MKTVRFVLLAAVVLLVASLSLSTASASPDLVYYVGTDNHVHELRFVTTWRTTDLMNATGAPNAAAGAYLTGHLYTSSSDNIYYTATDGHIHELAYYGSPASWHTVDITAAANAPNPTSGSSPLTSEFYGSTSDDVYYIATDGHVHEIFCSTAPCGWKTIDVTTKSGAPNPASGSPLTSHVYNTTYDTVYYIATDGHIHEMYSASNGSWYTTDVTAAARAPNPASGTHLSGEPYGSTDNVCYIATDAHLHRMTYNGSTWSDTDVTTAAGAPAPVAGSALTGNVFNSDDDIYFIDPNVHLHEVYLESGAWHTYDVSGNAGAPNPASGTAISSHQYNTAENIYYFASDEHVHECAYYNGSWHASDPSQTAGAPYAAIGNGLTSFAGI